MTPTTLGFSVGPTSGLSTRGETPPRASIRVLFRPAGAPIYGWFELALCFLSRRRDGPTRRQTENQGLGLAALRWRRAGFAAAAAWRSRATESR